MAIPGAKSRAGAARVHSDIRRHTESLGNANIRTLVGPFGRTVSHDEPRILTGNLDIDLLEIIPFEVSFILDHLTVLGR